MEELVAHNIMFHPVYMLCNLSPLMGICTGESAKIVCNDGCHFYLIVVSLTMLLVAQTVSCQMVGSSHGII